MFYNFFGPVCQENIDRENLCRQCSSLIANCMYYGFVMSNARHRPQPKAIR
jgi:hypothetical protein